MTKKIKLVDVIVNVLIIVLFIVAVYFILTRIFGHSATDLTIGITLFTFLGSLVFKMVHVMYGLNREFGEFRIKTINSFERLREDIGKIKNKIGVR